MVCVLLKCDAPEPQRLDEGYGGDVARVYLRSDHVHAVILEQLLEQASARLGCETLPLIRHEDHVGNEGQQVFLYRGL